MNNERAASSNILNWFSATAVVIALGFVAYLLAYKIFAWDVWWYLKDGQLILQAGSLIKTDPFAYTRVGQPYLFQHEWLFHVLIYLLHQAAGPAGIILFRTGMAAVCFLLVLLIDPKRIWLMSVPALWAINVSMASLIERPQLITYAFFAGSLLLAFRYLEQTPRPEHRLVSFFWIWIALQVVWVNLHGGASYLQMAVVGALLGTEGFAYWKSRGNPVFSNESWTRCKSLAVLLGALLLASLASPNTYHNIALLGNVLSDKSISLVREWSPSPWPDYLMRIGPFWGLALLALWTGRRARVFSAVILLLTGFLSRQALRQEVFFILSSVTILNFQLRHHPAWQRFLDQGGTYWTWLTGSAALTVLVLVGFFVRDGKMAYAIRNDNLYGYGVFDPVQEASQFLDREGIGGPMFNPFPIGWNLAYHGYPDRKIFLDGRISDFGYELVRQSVQAQEDPAAWESLDHRYGFSYAVIDYGISAEGGLVPYCDHLGKNLAWRLVYLDDWAAIYLKDLPQNHALIQRFEYRILTPQALLRSQIVATLSQEQLSVMEAELRRVIADSPSGILARKALAEYLMASGQPEPARGLIEEALKWQPYKSELYESLAAADAQLGRWEEAGLACEKALRYLGPNPIHINYAFVADMFTRAGDLARAEKYSRRAHEAARPH